MSTNAPHARLVGTWKFYLAPDGEAKPAVNATPAGNWVEVGPTDGEQEVQNSGTLEYFRDNDHQLPVKAVRPEEEVIVTFNLVGLTLENYARILHDVANVVTTAGTPDVKHIGFVRGFEPTEYALLGKGLLDSPYGAFPGQVYWSRAVSDGEPTMTRSRDGSPALECEFHALNDYAASAGLEGGYWEVAIE